MTTHYGFQKTVLGTAPMDVTHRSPPAPHLAQSLLHSLKDSLTVPRLHAVPTCVADQPCPTWVQYRPQWSDCAPTFVSWKEVTDNAQPSVELAPRDSRLWVADLNEMHLRRSMLSGAQWEAESTQGHIRNRQLWLQYLHSTLYPQSSPHEKRIDGVGETSAALARRFGPPQFTTF